MKSLAIKKGLLFNQIERQIIRGFYEESKTKSNGWIWWNKNIIVAQYESTKAQRDFKKAIDELINPFILKLIKKLNHEITR